MNKIKCIPIHYNNNYYVYDCFNKLLYPCTKTVYSSLKNSEGETVFDKKVSNAKDSNDSQDETVKIYKLISQVNQKDNKELYIFPKFQKKDILESLARTSHITLEITESCNLHCAYCCYGDLYKKTQHNKHGNKSDILRNISHILNLKKTNNIKSDLRISFYGGEPLIRFDIIEECIKVAHSILPDVNIKFSMTTNGILLKKHMDFLVKNDFHLCISLDGNSRNNEYRIKKNGEQSFSLIEESINELYEYDSTFFKNNVSFSTVLHDKSNCIDACRFFSKYKKVPTFSFLSTSGVKKSNRKFSKINTQHNYSAKELDDFKRDYPDLYKTFFTQLQKTIYTWGDDEEPEDFNVLLSREKYIYPGGSCLLFQNRVFVTVDGILLLCEKSLRKFKFGKITSNGFTIYEKRINKYYSDIIDSYNQICSKCYKSFSCTKCYFSNQEEVIKGVCICSKKQAMEELENIINSHDNI